MHRTRPILAIVCFSLVSCTEHAPLSDTVSSPPAFYANPVPAIGARVRIIVPSVGPGWRVGMLNRTRQEPPCYVVLLFNPRGKTREVVSTVHVGAAVRMQVSTMYDAIANHDPDPGAAAYDGESWLDVRLDSMKTSGRNCPPSPERTR